MYASGNTSSIFITMLPPFLWIVVLLALPIVAEDSSLLLQTGFAESGGESSLSASASRCVEKWKKTREMLTGEKGSDFPGNKIIEDMCALQNPSSCKNRRVLMVGKEEHDAIQTTGCGFGCTLAHVAYVLAEGIHRDVTVIMNPTASSWWNELFEPLSSCTAENSRGFTIANYIPGQVALWSLPPKYRGLVVEDRNTQAKLLASSIVSYMMRPLDFIQKDIQEDFRCHTLGMYASHGVATMHVRQGDKVNPEHSWHNLEVKQLKDYFDQLGQFPAQTLDKVSVVHITSDSPVELETLTLTQRERWPKVTVTSQTEGCSSRHTAPVGEGVHKTSYLGGEAGILTNLTVSVIVMSEIVRDMFILASGKVFVGVGSSHFTATASLLHFSRLGPSDFVAERVVDVEALSTGTSPIGFLHKSNCDNSVGTDELIEYEIRVRKVDKYFRDQFCERSHVDACDARRRRRKDAQGHAERLKGISDVDSEDLIVHYDAELMTPVVNLEVFDIFGGEKMKEWAMPDASMLKAVVNSEGKIASEMKDYMGSRLVVDFLDEDPTESSHGRMNLALLHAAGICYDCGVRVYDGDAALPGLP